VADAPTPRKPLPSPVHWDAEFWLAAKRGELVAQRCSECRHMQHYPRPACANCWSTDIEWERLSGLGRIHTFTLVRIPQNPAFKDEAPFTLIDVELDEGVRIVSRLAEEPSEPVAIGARVRVEFVPTADDEVWLPFFRIDDAA
jgi:uncharacterized OB-fold protein